MGLRRRSEPNCTPRSMATAEFTAGQSLARVPAPFWEKLSANEASVFQGFGVLYGTAEPFADERAAAGFDNACASTCPSREDKVMPQRDASVGAMSAGVTSP